MIFAPKTTLFAINILILQEAELKSTKIKIPCHAMPLQSAPQSHLGEHAAAHPSRHGPDKAG